MESAEHPDDDYASSDDIRQAIENLSAEDFARIRKAAKYCLIGTEYQDPQELVNEAVVRAMKGAIGGSGRHWPKRVAFVAFMFKTIESIASGSRESPLQANTLRLEAIAVESANADDALAALGHSNACVVEQAVDIEETQERIRQATADSQAIDTHFATDEEITWIIMGYKDEIKAATIREISGMTATQYETAHRRFRRGLDKLFPGRRTS